MKHHTLACTGPNLPRFSVVVPVYGEEARMAGLMEHLFSLPAPGGLEVLVVDGSSDAASLQALEQWCEHSAPQCAGQIHCLTSPAGRGRQMNTGAQAAKGEILLFLHADTVLPFSAFQAVDSALQDFRINAGAFSLRIDSDWWFVRAIGHMATWRTRLNRIPFGDQALFFRRRVFHAVGGFQEIPIMEDLELMRRLARQGLRIAVLPECVTTSGRRWEEEGPLYCSLRNMLLRMLYTLGVGPQFLAKYYRRQQG